MNVPPKTLRNHVRSRNKQTTGVNGKEPEIRDRIHDKPTGIQQDSALANVNREKSAPAERQRVGRGQDAESLPVLGAFHKFLETERKRARNRTLTLTVFFLFVVFSIGGLGFFLGTTLFDQVRQDFGDLQQDIEVLKQEAVGARMRTQKSLAEFTGEAKNLREEIAKEQDAVADAQSSISSRMNVYVDQVDKLKETINTVQTENAFLKSEIDELKAWWRALSGVVQPPTPGISGTRMNDHAPDATGPEAATRSTIVMSVVPRNLTRAIGWRLPIPE